MNRDAPVADVVRMRRAGFTVPEIAADLGCRQEAVRAALRDSGLGGLCGQVVVEHQRLLELWTSSKTLSEIGVELCCSSQTVLRLGRSHGLQTRTEMAADPDLDVSPEEDAASADSLALSPWVQARIRELGLGTPV